MKTYLIEVASQEDTDISLRMMIEAKGDVSALKAFAKRFITVREIGVTEALKLNADGCQHSVASDKP